MKRQLIANNEVPCIKVKLFIPLCIIHIKFFIQFISLHLYLLILGKLRRNCMYIDHIVQVTHLYLMHNSAAGDLVFMLYSSF